MDEGHGSSAPSGTEGRGLLSYCQQAMSVQPLENRTLPSSQLKWTEVPYSLQSLVVEEDLCHVLQQSRKSRHKASIHFFISKTVVPLSNRWFYCMKKWNSLRYFHNRARPPKIGILPGTLYKHAICQDPVCFTERIEEYGIFVLNVTTFWNIPCWWPWTSLLARPNEIAKVWRACS